jgi:hypothetical protein
VPQLSGRLVGEGDRGDRGQWRGPDPIAVSMRSTRSVVLPVPAPAETTRFLSKSVAAVTRAS